MYEHQVAQMSRLVLEYVKSCQPMGPAHAPLPGHSPAPRSLHIGTTAEGFPLIPVAFNAKDCTRKVLQELYAAYLSRHYCECNHLLRVAIIKCYDQLLQQVVGVRMFHSIVLQKIYHSILGGSTYLGIQQFSLHT